MLALKRIYWKWLYRKIDSSFIYEVVRHPGSNDKITLVGPLNPDTIKLTSSSYNRTTNYKYAQVIEGQLVAAFKEEELLFTSKAI